jgi:hypothetical protein
LERLEKAKIKAFLPFYTLLEICGVTSFNLSTEQQKRWLYSFSEVYSLKILDPFESKTENPTISDYFLSLTPYILKKMTVGDAIFLKEAEMYNARAITLHGRKNTLSVGQIFLFTAQKSFYLLG